MTTAVNQPASRDGAYDPVALVQNILAGDALAEDALCRHFLPGLVAMLVRRGAELDAAEDAAQEALIVLLERLRGKSLDDPALLAHFARRVAGRIYAARDRGGVSSRTVYDDEIIAHLSDPQPSLAETLARRDDARQVRAMVDALPRARDRDVLRRRFLLEEPKAVTMAAHGLSSANYDLVVHRALNRLSDIATKWPSDA